MKGFFVAVLAPLWLLGAVQAKADPRSAAAHVDTLFRLADTNRDAVISEAESHAAIAAEFRRYDLDGDGLLSDGEIRKQQLDAGASQLPPDLQAKVIAATFAAYDRERNGRITLAHYQHVQHTLLLQADFDKDGAVSLREARILHGLEAP